MFMGFRGDTVRPLCTTSKQISSGKKWLGRRQVVSPRQIYEHRRVELRIYFIGSTCVGVVDDFCKQFVFKIFTAECTNGYKGGMFSNILVMELAVTFFGY